MNRLVCCLYTCTLSCILIAGCLYARASTPVVSGGAGVSAAADTTVNSGVSTLSVVNYGAKGDGVTDDSAAIQSAMAACVARAVPHNGCVLYFPAGVYITTGLTLQPFVHMKGDGWGTSVIQLRADTASDVVRIPAGTFNFSIYGLTIDGNSSRRRNGKLPCYRENIDWTCGVEHGEQADHASASMRKVGTCGRSHVFELLKRRHSHQRV